MLRFALFSLLFAVTGQIALAECSGKNLLATMSPEDRAAIRTAVDAQPYSKGNFWRATRGSAIVYLAGTYHFDDPRHDRVIENLAPLIDTSAIVLVEAGPEETQRLQTEVAKDLNLMFINSGPTMPELLTKTEWQALSSAMRTRDIPSFMAAKMRPWFITFMLATPPCAKHTMMAEPEGLDNRIIARAQKAGIPISALEPYDTVFAIFEDLGLEQQLETIRTGLLLDDSIEDQNATMADSYFNEDARTIWELSKQLTYKLPGKTREIVDAESAIFEEALMSRRNRAWIPVILDALDKGPVFVAFGALHLSGGDGVLALMEREGFTLERLRF